MTRWPWDLSLCHWPDFCITAMCNRPISQIPQCICPISHNTPHWNIFCSQIPQCICPISHNTPHWNRICSNVVYCGIWDSSIVGLDWSVCSNRAYPIGDHCWDFDSLWPGDTIWRQRSGSTLAWVMACCLMAPSHYLDQCWLIIS